MGFPQLPTPTDTDVWVSLAVPATAILWRWDGKTMARGGRFFARFVAYVEANNARQRLDDIEAGQWDLFLTPLAPLSAANSTDTCCAFKARLQVLGVVREDVGMGRDHKQAATDAFKRAAARFGIGSELYSFRPNWVELDGDGKTAKPIEHPAVVYARRTGARAPMPDAMETAAS